MISCNNLYQFHHRFYYTCFRFKPACKIIFNLPEWYPVRDIICWNYETLFHGGNYMFKILAGSIAAAQ